ncbi:hypothetical protein BRD12_07150 [Halobacteriales archaeon SW_12_67_38]|nr:MAG: hypothetical protein BRD12_07150 [Halobacteriales archaeon SW_12_67_38]
MHHYGRPSHSFCGETVTLRRFSGGLVGQCASMDRFGLVWVAMRMRTERDRHRKRDVRPVAPQNASPGDR